MAVIAALSTTSDTDTRARPVGGIAITRRKEGMMGKMVREGRPWSSVARVASHGPRPWPSRASISNSSKAAVHCRLLLPVTTATIAATATRAAAAAVAAATRTPTTTRSSSQCSNSTINSLAPSRPCASLPGVFLGLVVLICTIITTPTRTNSSISDSTSSMTFDLLPRGLTPPRSFLLPRLLLLLLLLLHLPLTKASHGAA